MTHCDDPWKGKQLKKGDNNGIGIKLKMTNHLYLYLLILSFSCCRPLVVSNHLFPVAFRKWGAVALYRSSCYHSNSRNAVLPHNRGDGKRRVRHFILSLAYWLLGANEMTQARGTAQRGLVVTIVLPVWALFYPLSEGKILVENLILVLVNSVRKT